MNFSYLDSVFEPIIILNKNKEIIYYNHYFSSFFKSSPRILKKIKCIGELFIGYEISGLLDKAIQTNGVQLSKEELITLPDQTEYHVVFKVVPQEDNIMICLNDITIEKSLYTKYRYQIDELKSVHNQIIQADKLTTIGEITASISHEVSNPLTIASGTIELLKALTEEGSLDEQSETISTCINDVDEAFARINSIIKGMKNFLHNNEENNDCEYISIEDSLDSSIKLLGPSLNQSNIEIKLQMPGDSIIFANNIKLEQVFVNLLKNSIDALKEVKSPIIDISLESNGVCYDIHFKDNGEGIPENLKEKIFESFFTTKDVGEGTGLGLAISSKIIDSYQGTLETIDSKNGSHFKISLPKMEVTSFSNTALASGLDTESGFLTILVVDNEPKILNLIDKVVSDLGHQLICASSKDEALNTIQDFNVDLIITDFHMPNGNGDDLAKAIRDNQVSTPIFYLTSELDERKFNEDVESFGISGLISKPFSSEDILEVISIVKGEEK